MGLDPTFLPLSSCLSGAAGPGRVKISGNSLFDDTTAVIEVGSQSTERMNLVFLSLFEVVAFVVDEHQQFK